VLNWALRTPESRDAMVEALEGRAPPDSNLVRFDPALNLTLDLAKGEDLVAQVDGNRYQVTAKGIQLANEIEKQKTAYVSELAFLETIGSRLTETLVTKML
jgi:3-deoxy-D-arabino-heptulosonate 7-phosphate (DAHP) synthase